MTEHVRQSMTDGNGRLMSICTCGKWGTYYSPYVTGHDQVQRQEFEEHLKGVRPPEPHDLTSIEWARDGAAWDGVATCSCGLRMSANHSRPDSRILCDLHSIHQARSAGSQLRLTIKDPV